ncbi:cell division protein FtsA [Candidatus Microgenomates bacterium]|nr:MAG: cell division protein FtsA [Candidatus Microgenomates bacterium]
MSKNKIIAAVDIGSSKITTLVGQIVVDELTMGRQVNIIGVANQEAHGVKKGQIVDIEEAVGATISSVEAAERMAGYNIDHAYVSVGGAHVSSQNSKGVVAVSNSDGEVTSEDVARVVEAARAISLPASREVIHVIPRDFIVDGENGVRDPVGMSGVRLEVETHIVTASSAALKNLTKSINEVGIQVDALVFSGLAAAQATLTPTEKELGCVLIDVGSGTTSIAAFVDGGLAYTGAIPIGARNVTNDLAIGLRVSLEAAEKIKLTLNRKAKDTDKHGKEVVDVAETGSDDTKKVSKRTIVEGIVRPRLNEIFGMVKRDLEKAGVINKIPSGAVVTGGGALTVGLEESAKRTLGLPTRIATPDGVGGLIDDILEPQFATVIGLIVYASSQEPPFAQTSMMPGISSKIKLPSSQKFAKMIDAVKNLLP